MFELKKVLYIYTKQSFKCEHFSKNVVWFESKAICGSKSRLSCRSGKNCELNTRLKKVSKPYTAISFPTYNNSKSKQNIKKTNKPTTSFNTVMNLPFLFLE